MFGKAFTKFTSAMRKSWEYVTKAVVEHIPLGRTKEVMKESALNVPEKETSALYTLAQARQTLKQKVTTAPFSELIGDNYATVVDLDFKKKYSFVARYMAYIPQENRWEERYASVQSNTPMTKERWMNKLSYAIAHAAGKSQANQFVVEDAELLAAAKFYAP